MMTASKLLDWLGDNQFLPAPQVEELRGQLSNFSDAHTLAKELVQRNWLTPDQLNQILQGKGDVLKQAELAAALTAHQLAQAIPLTESVPDGIPIVQAVPVAQAFPIAMPVAVQATTLGHAEPFGITRHDAEPADDQLVTTAPVAQAMATITSAPPKRSKARLLLFGGGAVLVLAITGAVIAMTMRGSRPAAPSKSGYGPSAALTILPLEPHTFKEGNSKFVIVKIQRKDFMGPVELTVKDPPTGISAQTIKFSDNQDTNQFRLTVSFGIGAMTTELRVVAKAENLQAETLLPLTVVTNRNDAVPD